MNPKPNLKLRPVRSLSYYFDQIIFQVEDTLFKVPRYHFVEKSSVFQDMFSIPQAEGSKSDGSSDENPLKLEGISKVDFERLLKVMYPLQFSQDLSKDEWISVLKLAKMWRFQDIHALAVARMTVLNKDPVDKVALGKEHYVTSWLRTGYSALVMRSSALSVEEGERIGCSSSVRIFHMRESRLARCRDFEGYSIEASMQRTFGEEFKEMEELHRNFYELYPT